MTTTLRDVARKYRVMVDLRERHSRDGAVAHRDELRALAEEFPSALREIDALPMHALRERALRAEEAARDPALAEPWMHWIAAWHALMAATLAMRRRLGPDRSVPNDLAHALAASASSRAGITLDVEYVRRVARPPGGRLSAVAFERLSRHFSVRSEVLREEMFPGATARGRC